MALTLTLLKPIESQNKRDKMHWAQKAKDRQDWTSRMIALVYLSNTQEWLLNVKQKEKRFVKVVSYRKRLLDYGNLVGGAKGMIDALKHARLIYDDCPQWIKVEYVQCTTNKGQGPCTTITIDKEPIA
jgi:hypothetical protein